MVVSGVFGAWYSVCYGCYCRGKIMSRRVFLFLRRWLVLRLCIALIFMTVDVRRPSAQTTIIPPAVWDAAVAKVLDYMWLTENAAAEGVVWNPLAFQATVDAIGAEMITESAAAVTAGVAVAPEVVTLLVLAAVGVGSYFAISAAISWWSSLDAKRIIPNTVIKVPPPSDQYIPSSGSVYFVASSKYGTSTLPSCYMWDANSAENCASSRLSVAAPGIISANGFSSLSISNTLCGGSTVAQNYCFAPCTTTKSFIGEMDYVFSGGTIITNSSTLSSLGCTRLGLTSINSYGVWSVSGSSVAIYTISSAISLQTSSQKSLSIDPSAFANLVNHLWQNAASRPGYQGLPYNPAMPLTAEIVSAWQATDPSSYPTVADMTATVPTSGTLTMPTISVPYTPVVTVTSTGVTIVDKTNPGVTVTVGNLTTDDLSQQDCDGTFNCNRLVIGPDYADPADDLSILHLLGSPGSFIIPSLENLPSLADFFSPLFSLFPGLSSFKPSWPSGSCPTGSVSAFGQTWAIDQPCRIAEDLRPSFAAITGVLWAFMALFLLLSA